MEGVKRVYHSPEGNGLQITFANNISSVKVRISCEGNWMLLDQDGRKDFFDFVDTINEWCERQTRGRDAD